MLFKNKSRNLHMELQLYSSHTPVILKILAIHFLTILLLPDFPLSKSLCINFSLGVNNIHRECYVAWGDSRSI